MTKPVPYERLIAFAAGRLPTAEAELVEAWLAKNPEAAASVRRFQEFKRLRLADDSVAVPESTLASAKELFADRVRRSEQHALSWMEKLERIVAKLILDSRPQVSLAGFRGGGDEYQLAYETDDVEVDLEIEPTDDADERRVMGQVSVITGDGATKCIVLSEPGSFEPVTMAEPDAHGMFELKATPGTFDLLLAVGETLVVVPNVEVQ